MKPLYDQIDWSKGKTYEHNHSTEKKKMSIGKRIGLLLCIFLGLLLILIIWTAISPPKEAPSSYESTTRERQRQLDEINAYQNKNYPPSERTHYFLTPEYDENGHNKFWYEDGKLVFRSGK